MAALDRLQIRRVPRADGAELQLSGELSLATANSLVDEVGRVERPSPALLVLDLRELRFMDSTGLALLIAAQKRARRDGRRLVVVLDPGPVERLFRLSGLEGRFETAPAPPGAAAT